MWSWRVAPMTPLSIGASGPVGLTLDAESQNLAGEAEVVDTRVVQATSARVAIHRNFTVALGIAAGTLGSVKAAAHRALIRPATFYQSGPRSSNFLGRISALFICVIRAGWNTIFSKSLHSWRQKLSLTYHPHVDSRICCAQATAQDRAHTKSTANDIRSLVTFRNREHGTV